jgi:hypothetical protein
MSYDDEILMAFADGELDEVRRAEIAAAVAKDPELARRVERHRTLRAQVASAFAPVLDRTIPDPLRDLARGPATNAVSDAGNVVPFPKRATATPPRPWRAREWFAVAASLVLGLFVSWQVFSPAGSGLIESADGSLVARGDLARALDGQLAADNDTGDVVLGVSFKAKDGGYCRQFALREAQTAGLACRVGDSWRIPVAAAAEIPEGQIRQASVTMPIAVLAEIDERISGEPLDAAGEAAAKREGWRAAAPQ